MKNGHFTKTYLKIQYNLVKILILLFTEREISIINSHENIKDTEKKNRIKQRKQCWKDYSSRSQDILQNHTNKNDVVLAQKQTCRPVGQN